MRDRTGGVPPLSTPLPVRDRTGQLRCRRSASAVNSAAAPYDLRNTQQLAILPTPRSVGECRSAIVICHFYSVGEHSSAWCPTSSHEPPHIRHESVRETQLLCSLLTAKSPNTQRRDAARRRTFIRACTGKFSRTTTYTRHESHPRNTTVLFVIDCKQPKYTAAGRRRRDTAARWRFRRNVQ